MFIWTYGCLVVAAHSVCATNHGRQSGGSVFLRAVIMLIKVYLRLETVKRIKKVER